MCSLGFVLKRQVDKPKMRQVHQILPFFAHEDAIGNHVLEIRRWLRQWGYRSEIFVENCDAPLAKECHSYEEYQHYSSPENLLILHYSIGGPVNRYVLQVPDRVIIFYHNITPAHYFYRSNGHLARQLEEARRDLEALAGKVPAIAASQYNALELQEMGFSILGVVPPVVNLEWLDTGISSQRTSEPATRFCKQGTQDWLFVGRIVPNKCIHDILKAFYYYHIWIDSQSRLLLVGATGIAQPYMNEIQQLAQRLGLGGSVIFTGHVTNEELGSIYRMADLYVSMSEHEGFCVPLVEAMYCRIPILAYASTGIPDTMGDAGVLIKCKDYPAVAELAHEMISNNSLRERLVEKQRARLAAFVPDVVQAKFRACLDFAINRG